ncbi:MAG TPA: ArsA-related P-loop ATPase, partial [Jatrophihabitantaceae bacterium]|nr:ArsA-related P-loop ATPase [Jatrophihabitantaceae bacterium]
MVAPASTAARTVPGVPAGARLHVVTGKGGTGKTTVAATLAMALAEGGRRTLLVEVEGRQALAQLFDVAALPYEERHLAAARGGGEVMGLAIDPELALLEYLEMFYNLKRAGRVLKRMGAIDFATTLAPGVRDVLLTGKVKETTTRTTKDGRFVYDAVVLDAPPTGRIRQFLDATTEVANL